MDISKQLNPYAPRGMKSHQRFVVLAVLFSLSMLTIVDRVAVSAAKMDMSLELGFTDITFGLIFGAFALGYALFQIPAGLLADRFGSRLPMASVVGLWSLFTGLTIFIRNAGMFVGVWFFFGTAEAGAYPISARVIRSWLPACETGMARGILFNGSRLTPASLGFLIRTAAMCGAAQARTPWGSVLPIAIATFGVDLTLSPSWTLCIDIAGARTGTLSGAMNMCGNLGSFASSLAFPMLVRWTGRSDTLFYCAAAINLCAAFLLLKLNDRKQKMKTLSYG